MPDPTAPDPVAAVLAAGTPSGPALAAGLTVRRPQARLARVPPAGFPPAGFPPAGFPRAGFAAGFASRAPAAGAASAGGPELADDPRPLTDPAPASRGDDLTGTDLVMRELGGRVIDEITEV